MGITYEFGVGVSKDYMKAYAWLSVAAAQGDKEALKFKDSLRERMTPEQLAEAEKLTDEISKRIEASKPK